MIESSLVLTDSTDSIDHRSALPAGSRHLPAEAGPLAEMETALLAVMEIGPARKDTSSARKDTSSVRRDRNNTETFQEMDKDLDYMRLAIEEAREGILNGHGGPFGSIIVKDGEIVGRGHNRVLADNDPTCHGEVAAIRDACENLGTFDLSGCEIYTTGEPCHMCLCACMWSNISKIYYGCTIADNDRIGFRDEKFDRIFGGREKLVGYLVECDREECLALFDEYLSSSHGSY